MDFARLMCRIMHTIPFIPYLCHTQYALPALRVCIVYSLCGFAQHQQSNQAQQKTGPTRCSELLFNDLFEVLSLFSRA